MPARPRWIIFYDDGTVISSCDKQPWSVQRVGALFLIQEDSDGKWVFYQQNAMTALCWGWRSKGEWVSCDIIGAIDYFCSHDGPFAMVVGRWTSNENYEKIRREADEIWRILADG